MQQRLVAELERPPGPVAAGTTNFLPATGATLRYQVSLEGVSTTDDGGRIAVGMRMISRGYVKALGAPGVAGEPCPPLRYDLPPPRRALINRAFAERYGPNLVGRHFTIDQFSASYEIIGIVGDLAEDGPAAGAAPYAYTCDSAGAWPDPEYVVRTAGNPASVLPTVRAIAHRLDPTRPIFGVRRIEASMAGGGAR